MKQHLGAALGLAAVVGVSGLLWAQEGGDQNRGNERPNREQRERAERERGERAERAERERGERAERGERPRREAGERGQRGERGERGGERGDWRARMAERMKAELDANDEEWTVLEPKIQKVMEAQRGTRVGLGGRMGGPGGPGGAGNPESALAKATTDLRDTLNTEEPSAEVIQRKLQAIRAARKQAEADLSQAREDLRSLLTPRQEASLVVMGILD